MAIKVEVCVVVEGSADFCDVVVPVVEDEDVSLLLSLDVAVVVFFYHC